MADIEQALRATRSSAGTMAAIYPFQSNLAALGWLFRVGFAGVFLVNGFAALLDPGGFIKMMPESYMRSLIPDFAPLVWPSGQNCAQERHPHSSIVVRPAQSSGK